MTHLGEDKRTPRAPNIAQPRRRNPSHKCLLVLQDVLLAQPDAVNNYERLLPHNIDNMKMDQEHQQQCPIPPHDMLERQMVAQLQECQDEFEAIVRKHQIVVEMQNMAEGSKRMREFLECHHYSMQRQPSSDQNEVLLLGAMIEFNNCLAYQMDRLEARVATCRWSSTTVTSSDHAGTFATTGPPSHSIDAATEMQQQLHYQPSCPLSSSSVPSKVSSACPDEQSSISSEDDDDDVEMPWEATTHPQQ